MIHLTISCLLSLLLPLAAHDFHVSKCDIFYRAEHSSLEIVMHIFIDDLEIALEAQDSTRLRLCTPDEHPDADARIAAYLARHFEMEINHQKINMGFLGKEMSDDFAAVWCYLEAKGIPRPESVWITNSVLCDVYDDQKNIVSFQGPSGPNRFFLFQTDEIRQHVAFQ